MDERQEKLLAFYETIGSIFWFLLDGAWLLQWKLIAFTLIIPTAISNIVIFRYTKRNYNDLAITSAMTAWLLMNIFWIVSDLRNTESLMLAAKISFLVGVILLTSVAIRNHPKQVILDAARRFRRLRFPRP